jgi:hypothetical protein
MKFSRKELIRELTMMTEQSTEAVVAFKSLPLDALNYKEHPQKWSILECIEHLNLYGDFYLPEIERRILIATPDPDSLTFSSGIIGDYFANLMKYNDGKLKKMKSPKDKNPVNSELSITLDRFLKQQDRLRALLQQSSKMDLTKVKCSISLTPLIKLRLGDTLRFFIYHIDRHVQQARKAQTAAGVTTAMVK